MPRSLRRSLPILLCLLAASAQAADPETPLAAADESAWEGAIGATLSHRPEYSGATSQVTKLTPALFLRYGRFTITNASGFVTRRADDVVRGLGLDLVRSERVRLGVSLRFDAGRSESRSAALRGLGDVKPTVRVRANAGVKLDGPWRMGASWSVDAFGRGGGNVGDIGGAWEQSVAPDTTLTLGTSLSLAGDRYMQTYFGINQAQASRTGYPVYTPSAGLRDLSLFANVRHDLGADWILLGGASVTRLLGPAAASPLTTNRSNWGLNAGIARRF